MNWCAKAHPIGAILVGKGLITGPGLLSPLKDVPYQILVDELARRGIAITREETVA